MVLKKGTYVSGLKMEDQEIPLTEKGFIFEESEGKPLAFDVHEHSTGMALLFGEQIFFLGFWTDEQLDKASDAFNYAIDKEKRRRK